MTGGPPIPSPRRWRPSVTRRCWGKTAASPAVRCFAYSALSVIAVRSVGRYRHADLRHQPSATTEYGDHKADRQTRSPGGNGDASPLFRLYVTDGLSQLPPVAGEVLQLAGPLSVLPAH